MKVSISSVSEYIRRMLNINGVSEESAAMIADAMIYAGRCGVTTHSIRQLPMYLEKIKAGHLNPADDVRIISDNEAVAVLDAQKCFGQVAAKRAIDIAVEKARRYGAAVVGIRSSNTFGAAGYYGYCAAEQGMASVIFANAAPAIAPTGGTKTIFGTNPICFAFPGSDNNLPIILDMATTVAARSKVRMAAKNGEKIPADWAIGPDGKPTDDPEEALKGSLLPIGGYKGYGLSLFVDLFAGMLTGAAFGGQVKPLSDMTSDSGCGQLFVVFDTARFMDKETLYDRIDRFCDAVRKCGEEGSVMLPGEPQFRMMQEQEAYITLTEEQFEKYNLAAAKEGISARLEEVK